MQRYFRLPTRPLAVHPTFLPQSLAQICCVLTNLITCQHANCQYLNICNNAKVLTQTCPTLFVGIPLPSMCKWDACTPLPQYHSLLSVNYAITVTRLLYSCSYQTFDKGVTSVTQPHTPWTQRTTYNLRL